MDRVAEVVGRSLWSVGLGGRVGLSAVIGSVTCLSFIQAWGLLGLIGGLPAAVLTGYAITSWAWDYHEGLFR